MGDIIEFTRNARHPTQFYRVTTNCVSFEVKASYGPLVGLAKEPGSTCDYWVGFATGGKICIQGSEGQKSNDGGNYSVNLDQFRRFWIAWDCGTLRVGIRRDHAHALSYPYSTTSLDYVTFCSQDQHHTATWRIELPPASAIGITCIANNMPNKVVKGGKLRWVPADDALPDNAVIGGFEGECLYIIRAHHNGSLTPGKFVPSEGVAYISWGGDSNPSHEFEVLCGYDFTWEATSGDRIPSNAFEAGYSEVNNEKLYIGRVRHQSCLIPGKVQPSHKVCYAAVRYREMAFKNFEILTIPGHNPYAATPYLQTNMATVSRHPQDLGLFVNVRVNRDDDDEDEEDNDEVSIDDGVGF